MKTVIKTRIEIYLPFKSINQYDTLKSNLIELFCFLFGGCTVIDKIDGYYRQPKTGDIIPDILDIICIDISRNNSLTTKHLIEFCKIITKYINGKLDEEYIYFSIGGAIFPRGLD